MIVYNRKLLSAQNVRFFNSTGMKIQKLGKVRKVKKLINISKAGKVKHFSIKKRDKNNGFRCDKM